MTENVKIIFSALKSEFYQYFISTKNYSSDLSHFLPSLREFMGFSHKRADFLASKFCIFYQFSASLMQKVCMYSETNHLR